VAAEHQAEVQTARRRMARGEWRPDSRRRWWHEIVPW
jgi:hypothetical protein